MLVCFQRESYLTLYEKKLIYGQEHAKLKGLMMTDAFEEYKTLRSAETSLQFKRFWLLSSFSSIPYYGLWYDWKSFRSKFGTTK